MFTLRDYQQKGVNDIRNAWLRGCKAPLYCLPTGGGKCLAKGTPILMFDGTIKPVEEINKGDRLAGHDGKPRNVLSTNQGKEVMYRVTPTKGDPYIVNESHILSLKITRTGKGDNVVFGGKKYKGGEIANVSILDYLAASKTSRHRAKGWRAAVDFRPNIHALDIDPYFIGLWLGDGNSKFAMVTSGDLVIEDYINSFADKIGMNVRKEYNSEGSFNYHIIGKKHTGRGGNRLNNMLKKLGVINNKHIPLLFKRASKKERLQLLAGLIDSDGSYTGKGYDICLSDERLFDDILFVARSLGFAAYKAPCLKTNTKTGKKHKAFRMNISGHVDQIPCKLERKKAAPRKQKKNVLVHGITVEKVGYGDYYGFEIDGDRLFMLGDFTVTHNTIVFCYVSHASAKNGKKVLILVHRVELLRQTAAKLRGFGIRTGLISPLYTPDPSAPVQVAMVQTVINRFGYYPNFDLIITDEAHHAVAGNYVKVQQAYPSAYHLGVTATPCRGDGLGLGQTAGGPFDALILGPTVKELIAAGHLVQPVLYAPTEGVDFSNVPSRMGDFSKKGIDEVFNSEKKKIIGSAIEYYRSYTNKMPAVAFCHSVKKAEETAADFRASGYKFYSVDGKTDDVKRDRIFKMLGDGSIHGVTSCDLISEGTDIPAITAAFLLRPTQSTGLYLQQVGRALRPSAGKDKAYIFDHVENYIEHGFPEDDRPWTLEGEKRKRRSKKNKKETPAIWCEECLAVHAPTLRTCPHCGHIRKIKGRKIEQVEGRLVQLTDEQKQALRVKKEKRMEQGKAQTLDDLRRIAKQRGYKAGWADHIYKARLAKKKR